MKHWNYRVIEFAAGNGEPAWRELREVFYDDSGKPCAYGGMAQLAWSVEEDPDVPNAILERMRAALGKPILYASDFNSDDQAASGTAGVSYSVTIQEDPDSDDLILPLPQSLLDAEDWRVGDRIRFDVLSEGRAVLTNLSKAERLA
jgi:hypothetical protein